FAFGASEDKSRLRMTGGESASRCEAGEVVEADLLFEARDVLHDFLETVGAEEIVLLLFELLPQGVELLCADDAVQGGEEDGVLAHFVRAVHADEELQGTRDLGTSLLLAQS